MSGDILGATDLKGPVSYRYKDLKAATKNFSDENKLGEGGFGDVYKVISTFFIGLKTGDKDKSLFKTVAKITIHGTGHFEKWEDSCSEEIIFWRIREDR